MRKHLLSLLAAIFVLAVAVESVSAQTVDYLLNENFNALQSGVPTGWDNSQGTSSNSYRWQSHSMGYNGSRGLRFNSYMNSSGNTSILFTPPLDLTNGEWILTFKYLNKTGGDFSVYISTDGGTTYLTNPVEEHIPNCQNWTEMSYSITGPAAHSANVRIAFRGESNFGNSDAYIYLDDVTVESAPTCKAPVDFSAQGVTQTQATIFWGLTPYGAVPGVYVLNVSDAAGNAIITNDTITPVGTSYTLTGLTAGTTYNVSLQGDCHAAFQGFSQTSDFTFTTLCQPQGAPFATNFDTATAMPGCSYTLNAEYSETYRYGSSGQSLALNTTRDDIAYIIFPELNLATNNAELTFFICPETVSNGAQQFIVALVNDPFELSDIEILYQDSLTSQQWREVRVNTANCHNQAGTTTRLMIFASSGIEHSTYIDNVSIHTTPTCIRPEGLAVSHVSATTADFSWTTSNATQARITAIAGEDTTYYIATSNPFTVTGLTPNTDYRFYIRGLCSATDSSEFNPYPVEAHTLCTTAEQPAFTESFEQLSTSNTAPECWLMGWYNRPSSVSAAAPFTFTTAQKNFGSRSMKLVSMPVGTHSYLATRCLSIDQAGKYIVRLWVKRYASGTDDEGFKVWVNTTPDDTVGGTCLGYIHRNISRLPIEPQAGWYEYEYIIPRQGDLYVMIEAISAGTAMYIDDISVSQAPACIRPKDVVVGNATANTVDITWQAGQSETSWNVNYAVLNVTGDTLRLDTVITTQPNYTITGLNSSMTYYITGSVVAECSVGVESDPRDFQYTVDMVCTQISELPYNEGFEDARFPPICWQNVQLSPSSTSTSLWSRSTNSQYIASGSGAAYRNFVQSGSMPGLVSPEIVLPAGTPAEVRFAVYRGTGYQSYTDEGIKVYVGTNDADTAGNTLIGFIPQCISNPPVEDTKGIYYYTFDIPQNITGANHIIFGFQGRGGDLMALDDITVRATPSCPDMRFTTTDVASTSARVVLSSDTVPCNWQISYGPEGTTAGYGTIINCTAETSHTLTGLSPETVYDIYIRRDCGTELGDWSQKRSVKTPCATASLPIIDDFESYATNVALQDASCYNVRSFGSTYIIKAFANKGSGNSEYNHTTEGTKGLVFSYNPTSTSTSSSSGNYDVTQMVHLEADKNYEISIYAKAYNYTYIPGYYDFDLSFVVGQSSDALNVIATHRVSNNDFEQLVSYFYVAQDGDYAVGFRSVKFNNNYYLFVDDYSLREVPCIPPTSTIISQLTSNSATINLISGASQWEIAVSTSPIDINSTVTGDVYSNSNITSKTVNLTSLSVNTLYYYTFRSICNGAPSDWMAPQTFRTRCTAITPPYSTSFDDVSATTCWTAAGAGTIGHTIQEGNTAPGAIAFSQVVAVSPEINVSSLNGFMISGMIKSATDSLLMDYGIMLDPDNTETYEPLGSFLITPANTWVEFTAYFDSLGSENYRDFAAARYIALATGQNTVYVDDLTIETARTCPKPTDGRITVALPRQLTLDWADNASVSSWLLRAVAADGVEIIVPATSHPAVISGLRPATQYTVYVAAVCSATDTSSWSQVGQIVTDCDFITEDYSEDFNSMTTDKTPTCWDISGSTQGRTEVYLFGVHDLGSNKCLRMHNCYLSRGTYAEIRTPEFVLQAGKQYIFEFDLAHQASCSNLTLEVARRGTASRTTVGTYPMNSSSNSYSTVSSWQRISVDASPYVGDTVSFFFSATSDYDQGAIFLDNVSMMEILSCSDISDLSLTGIGEHTATATFVDTCAAHTQWEYVIVPRGAAVATGTALVATTTTINLTGLTTATAYDLYVRSSCGQGDYGHRLKLQFSTTNAPATMPYVCDFADSNENSQWLMTGDRGSNCFIIGDDPQAVLSSGNALYVSGNNATCAYNVYASLCYAARTVEFGSGEHNVEFDWKCTGGYGNYDFARIFLVPAYVDYRPKCNSDIESASYSSFTWPTGAIAIDGGRMINLIPGWQHSCTKVDMTGREGVYNIVVVWRNINNINSVTQAPIAVDNIAIRPATCADVDDIAFSDITFATATASFVNPDGDLIRYVVSTSNVTADSVLSDTTTAASVFLTGLDPSSVYNFIARRECTAADISVWTAEEFQTECAPKAFPITVDFESTRFPSVCWQEASLAPGQNYYGEEDGHWARYTSSSSSSNIRGTASAVLSQGSGAQAMLISPEFTLQADREYHYSFWRKVSTSANYAGDYYDLYINQTPDFDGALLLGSFSGYSSASGLVQTDVDLPAGLVGNYYAILVGRVSDNYNHNLYVDDITIDAYPLCRNLATPIVEKVTATTATVSVAMHGQSLVEFGVASYSATVTPANITQTANTTTGRAQITGLTAGTSYAFFARAICTFSGDTTDWTYAARGVTKADDCFAPEGLKVLNLSDTNLTICWNDIPNATTCVYEIMGTQFAGITATDTAVINGLTAKMAYTLRVCGLCGTDSTAWTTYSFRTIGTPAELPYQTGFEQTADNALWNNVTSASYSNFTVGGTDAGGRSAGQRGLYITTDGSTYGHEIPGLDAGYNNADNVVYVMRTLHFATAGTYQISFDWKCDAATSSAYYKAYGRSFLAPADVQYTADRATGATVSPDGSIDLISQMQNTQDWTQFNRVITVSEPGYRNLVFEFINQNLNGYAHLAELRNVPLAVDNVSIAEISCMPVSSMSITSVCDTAATAVIAKTDAVSLEYALTTVASVDSISTWQTLTSNSIQDTLLFNGLTASTVYYLFARQACSDQDKSPWTRLAINTTVVPATLPYVCGFETIAENNNWLYSQEGQTNHFIIGSNTSNGGQKSLYITDDGTTFGYDANNGGSSYAFRTFYLKEGVYSYSFEWTCQGDDYGYDYGRAFFAPATETLVAGATSTNKMVPRTAILLDGGNMLNSNTAWLTQSGVFTITQENAYNLVFLWYSNNHNGNTPIAIDNIEITHIACAMPQMAVSNATETSVDVTFSGIAPDADVVYGLSATGSFSDVTVLDTIDYAGPTATRTITGLSASTGYNIVSRALCAEDEQSAVVVTPFSTACGVVTNFPFVEGFETMAAERYTGNATPSNFNDVTNHCWLVGSAEPQYCGTIVTNSQGNVISGNNTLIIDHQNGSSSLVQTVVALPLMDSIAGLNISFKYRGVQNGTVDVGYVTSPTNTNTFVSLGTTPISNITAQYSTALSGAPASAQRIAFRYTGYNYFMLDDIRVTRNVVVPAYSDTICFESDYTAHGFNVFNSQLAVGENILTRSYTAVNPGECDTLFTANVFRRAKAESMLYDTICEGLAYVNGLWNIPVDQVASKRYFNTFSGAAATGCDSTQTLYLTVMPSQTAVTDTICAGTSYQFGDQTITQTGIYTRLYQSPYGCSVTETLSLYVLPDTIPSTATLCQAETPYLWNGLALTASGIYYATVTGPRGCSQTEELRLTVVPVDSTVDLTICSGGQAQVADTILTTAGNYTLVRVNDYGCDITYHITVAVNAPARDSVADYACEGRPYYGYGLKGAILAADTTFEVWSRTADMCDSVTVVSIAFRPTQHTDVYDTIAAGDTYEWNDQTYTQPGDYTVTLQDSWGCDSVVTLHLEVKDGVDNVSDNGRMRIVPNPAVAGAQTLVFTEQTGRIVRVEILNSFGAVVDSREPQSTPISITAPAATGVYHVRVTSADGRVYVEKLIVR